MMNCLCTSKERQKRRGVLSGVLFQYETEPTTTQNGNHNDERFFPSCLYDFYLYQCGKQETRCKGFQTKNQGSRPTVASKSYRRSFLNCGGKMERPLR